MKLIFRDKYYKTIAAELELSGALNKRRSVATVDSEHACPNFLPDFMTAYISLSDFFVCIK
jgi:hypothetical protein